MENGDSSRAMQMGEAIFESRVDGIRPGRDGTALRSGETKKRPEFRKNRPGKFWSVPAGKRVRKRRRVEILVLSRRYKSLAESARSRAR